MGATHAEEPEPPSCSVDHGPITLFVGGGKSFVTTWGAVSCEHTDRVVVTITLNGVVRRASSRRIIFLPIETNWHAEPFDLASLSVYAEGPGGARTYYDVWSSSHSTAPLPPA